MPAHLIQPEALPSLALLLLLLSTNATSGARGVLLSQSCEQLLMLDTSWDNDTPSSRVCAALATSFLVGMQTWPTKTSCEVLLRLKRDLSLADWLSHLFGGASGRLYRRVTSLGIMARSIGDAFHSASTMSYNAVRASRPPRPTDSHRRDPHESLEFERREFSSCSSRTNPIKEVDVNIPERATDDGTAPPRPRLHESRSFPSSSLPLYWRERY